MRRLTTLLVMLGVLVAPSVANAAKPADVIARSETWLTRHGTPVLHRPVSIGAPDVMAHCGSFNVTYGGVLAKGCDGLATSTYILVSRQVWHAISTRELIDPDSAFVLLHEQLHQQRRFGGVEEGIVDARTYDLAPAWSTAIFNGWTYSYAPGYTKQVAAIRKASARMSGQPWRSRAARAARLQLWYMTDDQRDAALASVGVVVPPLDITTHAHHVTGAPRTQRAMVRYAPDLFARTLAERPFLWSRVRARVLSRWVRTHPAAKAAHVAAERRSPNHDGWLAVATCESHQTWTADTGNGYYGGLQFDRTFARTYDPVAYATLGTPNHWPVWRQMRAADRAYRTRGLVPWPNCGYARFGFRF